MQEPLEGISVYSSLCLPFDDVTLTVSTPCPVSINEMSAPDAVFVFNKDLLQNIL